MSSNSKKILILAGDGIGPEVMGEVKRTLGWFEKRRGTGFETEDGLVGGCSYDKYKTPLTDETMQKAIDADAVLLGAVGGPKWDNLPFADKPERGLLRLRKDMALFANLRNIGDVPASGTTRGPSTPEHATQRLVERYGSLWTIGVKGTF